MALAAPLVSLLSSAGLGLLADLPQQPPPEAGWWPGQQPPAARPEEQSEDPEGRRRPGVPQHDLPDPVVQENPGAIRSPPPEAFPTDQIPVPDRWRLIQSLGVVRERWWDPYNQNTLKGDRPLCVGEERPRSRGCRLQHALGLHGEDWFLAVSAVSDTVIEPRTFPIPVGVQTTQRPGSLDVFGRSESLVLAQTFIVGAALIQGSTAYMPPHREYRITLAVQANYVDVPERRILFVEPSRPSHRFDYALGVQELFVDDHLRNVSDRFDFDSIRIGIQPFQFDFRGFLFNDNQLGVRLFGNRDNNRFQYNIAAVWRLEKDTNSGLNNILEWPRRDWVLHANLFRQDFPFVGMTSQASVTLNVNRERSDIEVDDNGFPVRPALIGTLRGRNYEVAYLGYGADGRIGRINLSAQLYGAFGWDRQSVFTGETARITSFFAAAEPSYDMNWIRLRSAALYASGDGNPYDDSHGGFDAIFENPVFAGADTSYWIRQSIPFAGGGRAIGLNGRNGILNSLRSSKEQGQSNFANPGTILLGGGVDFDITPTIRVSANVNHLWFARTATLEALRMQGTIGSDIGWDVSAAAIWRPRMTQNLVFRASAAVLQPGRGFRDLFENSERQDRYYSVLLNAIVTY
ncbi:MAG TPA: hypothetical protein VD887_11535 [Allosphingosinicella sp.]|nr:hypothetical protein [Allosphingosinicella sp.]